MVMKKIIYIILIISFAFSCQKERLKDEKEIFIGEWELQYAIETKKWSGVPMEIDTIFPSNSPTTLTFKKNGKVFLNENGEEEKYKMNLKRDEARFSGQLSDVWFLRDAGPVSFSEKQHFFAANFHNGLGAGNRTQVVGSVGKDWLRINSSSKIISELSLDSRKNYNHFFKRIN